MLRKLLTFAILGLACTIVFGQGNKKNIELVGKRTYNERLSDVWAYVDGTGHEYAIVGAENGWSIVDLIDPTNPTELQYMPGNNTIWRDAVEYQGYAYGSNEGGGGITIMNLNTLPNQVVWKDTTLRGITAAHNIWMADGYLYVVGSDVGVGGMEIFDLQVDPWNPVYVGSDNDDYVHDVYIRDNIAYSAEINNGNLTVLDVTNKANIQILGKRTYQGAQTHNTWLNNVGDVCITTDELARGYLIAWDVTDPTDMKELDRIRSSLSSGEATPHNAHFLDTDFIVTSYYADGVHIVDANRPGNMVEVGYYDTTPAEGGGFIGCWGAYPYLPSGLILAADIFEGLHILRPTYSRACYLEGNVTDASNSNPLLNVQVKISQTDVDDLSKNNGDYAVGLADAGTYDVTYSKYGYEPKTFSVSLSNGNVTTQDVQLTPSTPVNLDVTVLDAKTGLPIDGAGVAIETFGFSKEFTSDATGKVTEPGFLTGQYQFIAGKWGYVTTGVDMQISTSVTSVTIELEKGYYDDYVFDFGWIADASSQSGNWERGKPLGTNFFGVVDLNPGEDVSGDYGDEAYVTGNTGTTAFDDHVGAGVTNLISPIIDFSTYIEPILSFEYWMIDVNLQAQAGGNDTLKVDIIDGATAIPAMRIYAPINFFWSDTTLDLTQYNLGNNVRIRFSAENLAPVIDVFELGIDKFQILEGSNVAIDPILKQEAKMIVYPIPAGEKVYVDFDLKETGYTRDFSFEIIDLQGRSLRRNVLSTLEGSLEIDFDLPSGVYLGILKHDGKMVKTTKIVK